MNTRALSGAVLTGILLGLVMVLAYLAGGAAKTALAAKPSARLAVAGAVAKTAFEPASAGGSVAPVLTGAILSEPIPAARARAMQGPKALDCLTDAVYYEARGESAKGQQAVAQVVLNRVRRAGFPKTVCGVVFQGAAAHACQFSFACDGAMRQAHEPEAWRRARAVAGQAMDGFVMQDVGDATNFHVAALGQIWGTGLVKVAQVGAHVFYRLTGHGAFAAHPGASHDDSPPDVVTTIPADGGGDQPSLILASAVTVKPSLGEGGPAGPPPEPASAPAAPAPAKAPAPVAKASASAATPVATAAKADG